uniref:Competence protein CoiA nuclease-like domain-containing protein n=1 Tax=viral metagenome TaxID=1070528 RepID=A0A6C0C7N0_9ZZZZ
MQSSPEKNVFSVKKNNLKVCECDFDPQMVYLVEEKGCPLTDRYMITICDYLKDVEKQTQVCNKKLVLLCKKGVEMIADSECFRHKDHEYFVDKSLIKWRKEWLDCFDGKTEKQVGNRRADVLIHENIVIEFLHSKLLRDNINARNKNYSQCNKQIYWVIECNESIDVERIRDRKRRIIFKKDIWKYDLFDNDYVYLNYKHKIYRIKPGDVKSGIIDVADYKSERHFVKEMKRGMVTWNDVKIQRGVIYYNQRGAGCGKTYESIQLLGTNGSNISADKDTFIYLTKMHSAKEVIYNELREQYNRGDLSHLNCTKQNIDNDGKKQYKMEYHNNQTGKNIQIIIGTIDSFIFAITTKKVSDNDLFRAIAKSIKQGYIHETAGGKVSDAGSIRYAQAKNVKLNVRCLIIIDEAQDLNKDYIEAFSEIVETTGIDVYVIGDKLQSIWGEHNVMTFLEKNNLSTDIVPSTGENCVKRFHEEDFIKFVNNIIEFKKYNLPHINSICDGSRCKYIHNDHKKPCNVFEVPCIYSGDTDQEKVDALVDKIINYMKYEIQEYNYKPNNFMFIFPILAKNTLANRIESKVQDFWIEQFKDPEYVQNVLLNDEYWKENLNDKFHKYVCLHKSEEGQSINLTESEHMTRILSIHSSKGNGCEVIFLLGLTEKTLVKFSKMPCNLVYDSLLHVSLTRQKKSLYVGVQNNNDDVWNRFQNVCNIESDKNIPPQIQYISRYNSYDGVITYAFDNLDLFEIIEKEIITPSNFAKLLPKFSDEKKIIDWGHHQIRFAVFWYSIMSSIVENEKMEQYGDQFKAVLANISELSIGKYTHNDYYKKLDEISNNNRKREYIKNKEIPILCLGDDTRSIYHKYKDTLFDFMKNIQSKTATQMIKGERLPKLCAMESIVMMYMIQIMKKGKYSEITIMDVYNIMYCYDDCSNSINHQHHTDCLCANIFHEADNFEQNASHKEIRSSMVNHYENIENIKTMYGNYVAYIQKFLKDDTEFIYNVYHNVYYGIKNENMSIMQSFPIVAHSENHVIFFVIKPQFNKLNFDRVMFDVIFNAFILGNCRDENNLKRFSNKKIVACIFTFDSNRPIFCNPKSYKHKDILKKCLKEYLMNKYAKNHEMVYNFYEYYKNNAPQNTNVIEYVNNELMLNNYKKIPMYIKHFFTGLKDKPEILKIDFLDQLNKYLEEKVDGFIS